MESVLRLFNALPIANRKSADSVQTNVVLDRTVSKGFVFAPEVVANYNTDEIDRWIGIISKQLMLTAKQMNSSFHKSWKKVRDADIEQLVMEQMVHYFTTYGFERIGMYSDSSVYIPREELDIPDLDRAGLQLVVIKGLTKNEIKQKVMDLLRTGIALAEDTIKDVVDVATYVGVSEAEIETVKNKEVRVMLFDYLNMLPKNPVEFLRFIVYKATNKTLLIKNVESIEGIKANDNSCVLGMFNRYDRKYGLEGLGVIFYRFKPLFLAFRTNTKLKAIINRIRRLARRHHKPMPVDYLNSVTSMIKNGSLDMVRLEAEIEKVNTFRKIRLAYALKFRTKDVGSILYRIRNGKGYSSGFKFDKQERAREVLDLVLESIARDIRINVEGKRIHIPSNMNYVLPATEKQFTGCFPSGTCVTLPSDMIFGIHWCDVGSKRVDLDLSLIGVTKIGWDGHYRSKDSSVLFSGDLTSAPRDKGASELFYVSKQDEGQYIVMVNFYNRYDTGNIDVPFEILVAKKHSEPFGRNYMVNPSNVIAIANTKISTEQRVLGLLVVDRDACRFYFAEINIGHSVTSYDAPYTTNSKNFLTSYYQDSILLSDILSRAGAEMVSDVGDVDIDLSPRKLEKDTILNLVKKGR